MSVESDLFNAILEFVKVHPDCTISVTPRPRRADSTEEEGPPTAEDEYVEFV